MSDADHESFNTTHGRQIDGKFYTYKELESPSFLSSLKNFIFYLFLIGLLLLCLIHIYEVDINKRDQKEVLSRISNYSFGGIVDGSVEMGEEMKKVLLSTLEKGSETGEEIKEWVVSRGGEVVDGIRGDVEESWSQRVLRLPIKIKESLVGIYENYIKRLAAKFFGWDKKGDQQGDEKVKVQIEVIKNFSTSSNSASTQQEQEKLEESEAVLRPQTPLQTSYT